MSNYLRDSDAILEHLGDSDLEDLLEDDDDVDLDPTFNPGDANSDDDNSSDNDDQNDLAAAPRPSTHEHRAKKLLLDKISISLKGRP